MYAMLWVHNISRCADNIIAVHVATTQPFIHLVQNNAQNNAQNHLLALVQAWYGFPLLGKRDGKYNFFFTRTAATLLGAAVARKISAKSPQVPVVMKLGPPGTILANAAATNTVAAFARATVSVFACVDSEGIRRRRS
jgi:hypothetical protein